jgi:hypothetical protein
VPTAPAIKKTLSPAGDALSAIRFENGDGRPETLTVDLVVEASGDAI